MVHVTADCYNRLNLSTCKFTTKFCIYAQLHWPTNVKVNTNTCTLWHCTKQCTIKKEKMWHIEKCTLSYRIPSTFSDDEGTSPTLDKFLTKHKLELSSVL